MRRAGALALAAGVLATGCARPPAPGLGAYSQPPGIEAGHFIAADGARLPLMSWQPEGRPRAVILAIHGFIDRGAAFERAAPWWARHGFAVHAPDLRGFGGAPGRGRWAGEATHLHDIESLARRLADRHAPAPVFLLGHSMGGTLVLRAMTRRRPPVAGAILVAPGLRGGPGMTPLLRGMSALISAALPALPLPTGVPGIRPTDNRAAHREFRRDPRVLRRVSARLTHEVVALMGRAFADAPKLDSRSLILFGARDQVIPPRSNRRFQARLRPPPQGPTVITYEQGWHWLLRDRQAPRVWADIAAWIDSRLGPDAK